MVHESGLGVKGEGIDQHLAQDATIGLRAMHANFHGCISTVIRISLTIAIPTWSVISSGEALTNDNARNRPITQVLFAGGRGRASVVMVLFCLWASALQQRPVMGRVILWLPPLHLPDPFRDCRRWRACTSLQSQSNWACAHLYEALSKFDLLQVDTCQLWDFASHSCTSTAMGIPHQTYQGFPGSSLVVAMACYSRMPEVIPRAFMVPSSWTNR